MLLKAGFLFLLPIGIEGEERLGFSTRFPLLVLLRFPFAFLSP